MTFSSKALLFLLLLLLVVGWGTQALTLFDIGRYSFPLILFVGLPFCFLITYRSLSFLVLPIASSFFAVAVGIIEGVGISHVLSQAVLQTLAIAFAAGIAAINWHRHKNSLEQVITGMGVPIVLYGCYQMVARVAHLPGAFLPVTNQQYYVEGGLQRDWDKAETTRASSIFSEPSELGYYSLWLLVIGLSTESKKIRIVSISLAAIGILVSQSLSAMLGAVAICLAYFLVQGVSRQIVRQIALLGVVFAGVAVGFKSLAPEAYDHSSERIVEAASFDHRADSGRVDHLPACMELVRLSPVWGYGLSGMAGAGSDGADVTTVNYVMVWLERGTIGALLFFIPWFTLTLRAWLLPRNAGGRTFAFLLLVMTLYSFTSFSLTYFLPFWLAFGVSASLVLHTYRRNGSTAKLRASLTRWPQNRPAGLTI